MWTWSSIFSNSNMTVLTDQGKVNLLNTLLLYLRRREG